MEECCVFWYFTPDMSAKYTHLGLDRTFLTLKQIRRTKRIELEEFPTFHIWYRGRLKTRKIVQSFSYERT